MVRGSVIAIIGTALLIAGCTGRTPSPTPSRTRTPTASATPRPTATIVPTGTAAPTPELTIQGLATAPAAARTPVLAAAALLAADLGLPPGAEVAVRSVTAKEWSDSSLGCPQPGSVYAQVITPGYVVVLEAEGAEYTYHTDRRGHAVACPGRSSTGGKGSSGP